MRDRKPKDINNVVTATKSNGATKIRLLTVEKGVLYQTKKKNMLLEGKFCILIWEVDT